MAVILRRCVVCGTITEGSFCPVHKWQNRAPSTKLARGRPYRRMRDGKIRDAAGRCERCGTGTRILEAHHLISAAAGGRNLTGNVVMLCLDCHRAMHGKR
jgi:5-methylcytosine-specific restriction endonuclease McrA